MAANVQTFMDFTGASADQAALQRWCAKSRFEKLLFSCLLGKAAAFLEMAGGDVETAVEIYMTSQGKKSLSQDKK